MEEKVIMNTALTYVKNACELLLHGSIESNTKKVNNCFIDGVEEYLEIQNELFSVMEQGGLYKIEQVSESKISKAASKNNSSI